MSGHNFIDTALAACEKRSQLRRLRAVQPAGSAKVEINERKMVNFCSNDYLGLSKHPLLIDRAIDFTRRYGVGSTGSRLICGTFECMTQVEEKLAHLKGTEAALIFNSGFQANVSILPALCDRKTLILSDALNHTSIIMGALLSRCHVLTYHHNDLEHLRALIEKSRHGDFSRRLIVTESVFSVDGDQSHIAELVQLAGEFDALLMVDEAHATGVLGHNGMGLCCDGSVDLVMGTFGKACGSFGAYAACSEKIRDYLVNFCKGFIYTTALPPSVMGAIDAALDLVPTMGRERMKLHEKVDFLRTRLNRMNWDTGASTTQIIPLMAGSETRALALSRWLEQKGFLATALRPPTVPPGESRIRLALSSVHTTGQLKSLLEAIEAFDGHATH